MNLYLPLTLVTYYVSMIILIGSKETKKIWEGESVKGFSTEIQETARLRKALYFMHKTILTA